jgi:hypothetical protein
VLALVALGARAFHAKGGGSSGRRNFEWTLDGPQWTDAALLGSAAALVLAALLLWAARRRSSLALGLVLVPLAVVGGLMAVVERNTAGRVSADDIRAARALTTEDAVRSALGSAVAGRASMSAPGIHTDCLLYVGETKDRWGENPRYIFCFDGGRVVGRWPPFPVGFPR